ncbi:hypothetical protein [Fusibacter sp. 3D3]|uniref:hypothetical protein n=1 Tax=Fusibacter sp. 3D3 TaxID=1048380 RepID=UPI000853474E|nr:hypothetical protein [Fusibacter sp. 3D3]GAU78394.1 hypothetical protein F3D3_3027 [Fusibacter sp. 3D3]
MKKTDGKSVLQWQKEMQFLEDYLEIYMVKSDSKPTKGLFLEDYLSECLEEIDSGRSYGEPLMGKKCESVCSQR